MLKMQLKNFNLKSLFKIRDAFQGLSELGLDHENNLSLVEREIDSRSENLIIFKEAC